MFPSEKHMEVEDPLSSGFLCLDCCFEEMFDDWQYKKKEGLDIGLVLYVEVKWWIGWPSFPSLSNCYGFMVYGFGYIWSKLGYAKASRGAPNLLARLVWSSFKQTMTITYG